MDGLPTAPYGTYIFFTLRVLSSFEFLIIRLNLLIIFTSMGFVAHSAPNYAAAKTSLGVDPGPVVTTKFGTLPLYSQVRVSAVNKDLNLIKFQVNGIMNMVGLVGRFHMHIILSNKF